MDQDAKIQQYVLLAKGLRGRGLTDLIAKATGDPAVFGFGELLDVQSVKEVSFAGDLPWRGHGPAHKGHGGKEWVHGWCRVWVSCGVSGGAKLCWTPSPSSAESHSRAPRTYTAQLQGTDLASHNALLQLFAYGTWSDYQGETHAGVDGDWWCLPRNGTVAPTTTCACAWRVPRHPCGCPCPSRPKRYYRGV